MHFCSRTEDAHTGAKNDTCKMGAALTSILDLVAWQPYKSKVPPTVYIGCSNFQLVVVRTWQLGKLEHGSCCSCHSAFDVYGCHATNQLNHPLDAFTSNTLDSSRSRVLLVNASRGWFNYNVFPEKTARSLYRRLQFSPQEKANRQWPSRTRING